MLGIDTSKDQLVCALYDRPTEKFRWEQAVPNSPAGVQQLLDRTPVEVPWILEPTGRYSLTVAQQARAAGRTVLLAPPRKAKDYLRSLTSRAKTDRLDSRGLALFAASRSAAEPLRPYPVKSAPVEHLDQLLTARRGIVKALTGLRQQRTELPHAAATLTQAITDLTARRDELDRQIAKLSTDPATFPATVKLQKIPGIGPVTSAAAAARLQSRDFDVADQWVAYLGLDIGIVQSGKRQGERGLTKQGDAELRRLFFLAAQSNVRSVHSPFRKQYERELAKGMSKTAALNAVARKIARVCWSIVKHDTEYDPARVHQPAPRPTKQAPGTQPVPERAPAGAPPGEPANSSTPGMSPTGAPAGATLASARRRTIRLVRQKSP